MEFEEPAERSQSHVTLYIRKRKKRQTEWAEKTVTLKCILHHAILALGEGCNTMLMYANFSKAVHSLFMLRALSSSVFDLDNRTVTKIKNHCHSSIIYGLWPRLYMHLAWMRPNNGSSLINLGYCKVESSSAFLWLAPTLNLDLKTGVPSVKVESLLRYENQLVMASAILISKVQPCPTSLAWGFLCACVPLVISCLYP